jgi:hypothetical protein
LWVDGQGRDATRRSEVPLAAAVPREEIRVGLVLDSFLDPCAARDRVLELEVD